MTITDYSHSDLRVRDIAQIDGRTFKIAWTDGAESLYDVVELRRKCPCATCIDEWTHQPRLLPEAISDDIRPERIDSVGRYALTIKFSDGHGTGIYPYPLLRKIAGLMPKSTQN